MPRGDQRQAHQQALGSGAQHQRGCGRIAAEPPQGRLDDRQRLDAGQVALRRHRVMAQAFADGTHQQLGEGARAVHPDGLPP